MTKQQKRLNVIKYLLSEQPQYSEIEIPAGEQEQKILLRSLFNIRMPLPVTNDFLRVQDAYLQEEIRQKGITTLSALEPIQKEIYLWRGDITTLQCDGIVNAANSHMLGCFCPNHGCIDNAIHTYAGVQLRLACAGAFNPAGLRFACFLLSFLFRVGRAKRIKKYCILLYLYGRVSLSERQSGTDSD